VGEACGSRSAAMGGVESIKRNAPDAPVVDQTEMPAASPA
jgi:uncharacterized protein YegP (UPF0339 family)